jgi:hypothetical protein
LLRIGVVLFIYAGYMLYSNPIRLHQTAHAGGLTMQVPSTWTPEKSGEEFPVILRREWAPFLPSGVVSVMDHSELPRSSGPWTMEAARKAQAELVAARNQVAIFSNTTSFDLKAGDRTAVCVESTLRGRSHSLGCPIVGTPLQFSFSGSRFAEPDAERMLASLN